MSTIEIYVCTDHDGYYPVGVCSVVTAGSEDEARRLLQAALHEHGLDETKPFTLRRLSTDSPRAFVLLNGEY
jgi:hypothetical protein